MYPGQLCYFRANCAVSESSMSKHAFDNKQIAECAVMQARPCVCVKLPTWICLGQYNVSNMCSRAYLMGWLQRTIRLVDGNLTEMGHTTLSLIGSSHAKPHALLTSCHTTHCIVHEVSSACYAVCAGAMTQMDMTAVSTAAIQRYDGLTT